MNRKFEDIKYIIRDADETGEDEIVSKVLKAENGVFTVVDLCTGVVSHIAIDYVLDLFHNGCVSVDF